MILSEVDGFRARLRAALADAIRARDGDSVAALRSVLSAIDNAEAVEAPKGRVKPQLGVGAGDVARRELSVGDLMAIVRHEINERLSAVSQYEALGRPEEARALRAQLGVLERLIRG